MHHDSMNYKTKIIILIHIAIWLILFFSPLMFMNHGDGITIRHFLSVSMVTMVQMIVFYLNYFWLTPIYLTGGPKKYYFIINTILIIAFGICMHQWMEHTRMEFRVPPPRSIATAPEARHLVFIMRNVFNLAISAGIATLAQLAMKWQLSENARREAETARADAELKNLKAQINPHFLLNTLNNIYSLTVINKTKAQEAIMELSKLLRYILYDNQSRFVSIHNEVQFLTNYINLMKIRVPDNVDIQFNVDVPKESRVNIAPLIFISLVENAFKHGTSNTNPCFIHINLSVSNETVECCIRNSNYPKNSNDRSGHGIGLEQVVKRLQLLYPDKHSFVKSINETGKEYISKITIYDTKLRYN